MKINLRVGLIIPDAEAATVKNTLIRRLGYQGTLTEVRKERLFSIDVEDGEDPEQLARKFAKELVNENKESYKASFGELKFEPGYIAVKVGLHIEDGEAISTRDRLRNRLGFKNVLGVEKATIWKLYLKGENQKGTARDIAEKMLINPHKDSYEILS
jgi:phosphoribosylformylglycinamidine synthase subunit PurS